MISTENWAREYFLSKGAEIEIFYQDRIPVHFNIAIVSRHPLWFWWFKMPKIIKEYKTQNKPAGVSVSFYKFHK